MGGLGGPADGPGRSSPTGEHRRLLLLLALFVLTGLVALATALRMLYVDHIRETRDMLASRAAARAVSVGQTAAALFQLHADKPASEQRRIALAGIQDSLMEFGATGEFILGSVQDGRIVFESELRRPIPSGGHSLPAAEHADMPLQAAINGHTGSMIGRDYRGETVVAGCAYVPELELGLSAKVDLSEIRAPFIRTAGFAGGTTLVIIVLGSLLFLRVTRPLLDRLEASEHLHRTLLASFEDPVMAMRSDMTVEYVNDAFCRMFGCAPEDLRGRKLLEVLPALGETKSFGGFVQCLRTGEPQTVHGVLGGRHYSVRIFRTPSGIIGMAEDTTDLLAAERARERLAAIIAGSDDAVLGMALDGEITDWNDGATRMYGYTADEVVGRHIFEIVPPGHQDEMRHVLQRIERGELMRHYETERVTKDGRRLSVALTISPIHGQGGEVIGASSVSRDISRQRELQAELEETRLREQELGTIGKVVGAVAHEMNNPLTGVMAILQMLHEEAEARAGDCDGGDTEQVTLLADALEQSERIRDAIKRLEHISVPKYREYIGGRQILDITSSPEGQA